MKDRGGRAGHASGKPAIAARLRSIREELYGEDGAGEMAGLLGLPVRTWLNYEDGITIPGDVLLRYMRATGIEPGWLLDGSGTKYRALAPGLR